MISVVLLVIIAIFSTYPTFPEALPCRDLEDPAESCATES
jgi:hypothetical protein